MGGEGVHGWLCGTRRTGNVRECGPCWSIDDIDAAWKRGSDHTSHSFVDQRNAVGSVFWAVCSITASVDSCQWCTSADGASVVGVGALLERFGQNILIPAHEKVTVESISGWVTVGEHESASIVLVDVVDTIQNLKEQVDKLNWEILGTDTVVDLAHVIDVSIVVQIQINTVPAGLKLNLGTESIRTICPVNGGCLWPRLSVQAVEANTVRERSTGDRGVVKGHGLVVIRSGERVSRKHLETSREWHDVFAVVTTAEIIYCHTTVGNFLERSIGMFVVKLRSPITRFVGLDLARRTGRVTHISILRAETNV